jgi:hypothetical protein
MFWPSPLLYELARYRQQELLDLPCEAGFAGTPEERAALNQLANSCRRVRRRRAKQGPGLLTRAASRVFNTVAGP